MGAITKIEWTDHTFNPWWGCAKVSAGCTNCYAESFAKRTGKAAWGPMLVRRTFGDKHWDEPRKWNVAAERDGVRRRVFCASMADVFERGELRLDFERSRLWKLILETPHLDWLLLTKRPENIERMVPEGWTLRPQPHVWLGVSVEDQKTADARIPRLLETPAVVRWVSYEPALAHVDFSSFLACSPKSCKHCDGGATLDNQVRKNRLKNRDRVPRGVQLPPGGRLPTVTLDPLRVPSDEPASKGGGDPFHHPGVGVVDGQAHAARPASSTTPVDVALAIEQPGDVSEQRAIGRHMSDLPGQRRAGASKRNPGYDESPISTRSTEAESSPNLRDRESALVSPENRCACHCHLRSAVDYATGLDWLVLGGESGPGARPFDVAWARSTVKACREGGVACFVKQLGAHPTEACDACARRGGPRRSGEARCRECFETGAAPLLPTLRGRKGGDIAEWPADLRVREFPWARK